jgi:putative flippase GtrA
MQSYTNAKTRLDNLQKQPNFRVISFELFRYSVISGVALLVDFACLLSLTHFINYLLAASISFVAGGVLAYYLSIRFVFEQHTLEHGTAELGAFIALGIIGLGVNTLILYLAVNHWSLSLPLSKLLAAGCTFTCNFALRKWLLFSHGHSARNTIEAASSP